MSTMSVGTMRPTSTAGSSFSAQILADHLFYYSSPEQVLSTWAKLNTNWRQASFQHLITRINDMNDETRRYEEAFEETVDQIKKKRNQYFEDYELSPPSKKAAVDLLNRLKNIDISNLRKVTRPTPNYEFFVAPLLILFD